MCVIYITIILLNPEELVKILSPTPTTRKSRGLVVKILSTTPTTRKSRGLVVKIKILSHPPTTRKSCGLMVKNFQKISKIYKSILNWCCHLVIITTVKI